MFEEMARYKEGRKRLGKLSEHSRIFAWLVGVKVATATPELKEDMEMEQETESVD